MLRSQRTVDRVVRVRGVVIDVEWNPHRVDHRRLNFPRRRMLEDSNAGVCCHPLGEERFNRPRKREAVPTPDAAQGYVQFGCEMAPKSEAQCGSGRVSPVVVSDPRAQVLTARRVAVRWWSTRRDTHI